MFKCILSLMFVSCLLSSCASREKMAYYQNITSQQNSDSTYTSVLKPDDLLMIIVSSPVPEAAADFNLTSISIVGDRTGGAADAAGGQLRHQSYLIDKDGFIEFPVLGKIQLGGLTREGSIAMLKEKLRMYIKDPIINLRILNFKITVQGEVSRPGTFQIATERITLPEALAMAGDLSIYGKRDNILIIREGAAGKTYNFVDITNGDFINSPFYYLTQNDLVYVEPNKTRMNASVVGPNVGVIFSGLSLLITIVALLIR